MITDTYIKFAKPDRYKSINTSSWIQITNNITTENKILIHDVNKNINIKKNIVIY